MALPSGCNSSSCASQVSAKHKGICPDGWHIPSNADWDKLYRYADGTNGTSSPYESSTAGKYLKATSGWNSDGNSQDKYGFSALPGGNGYSDGRFYGVGNNGDWWSSNESNTNSLYADYRYMGSNYGERAYYSNSVKRNLYSVRCIKD